MTVCRGAQARTELLGRRKRDGAITAPNRDRLSGRGCTGQRAAGTGSTRRRCASAPEARGRLDSLKPRRPASIAASIMQPARGRAAAAAALLLLALALAVAPAAAGCSAGDLPCICKVYRGLRVQGVFRV